MINNVNHPTHYNKHPSGIECIEIAQYFDFCLGAAFKYIWRYKQKGSPEEDLNKALWYIEKYQEKNNLCLTWNPEIRNLVMGKIKKVIEFEPSNLSKKAFELIFNISRNTSKLWFNELFEIIDLMLEEVKVWSVIK